MGVPHLGAKEVMDKWAAQEHTLVVFTTRATNPKATQAVIDWLGYFEIPFTHVTNVKGDGGVYIDNKGYKFTTWPDVSRYVDVMWPIVEAPRTPQEAPDAVEW
jgi:hypothetical protein